ncbi:uncharacterized protein DS421_14g459030 [Arachis hypogaea]|nr:uncharacterized protein DS421_14g459030 [Arachis hypogaea]
MGKKKLVETRCSPCYINGMITHLQEINADAKLAEIDAIGFGFVKQIPRWAVKQTIMIQLARAYDVETDTLIVDVGNIPVSAELIGRALGIPSNGVDIPKIQKKNPAHREIKEQFKKKTTTQLRDFVYACPMDTEADRINFRRYFILVKTFKWLGKVIETHQNKKFETCGGCMFALMLLYFQRLRHGPLERCQETEPWLTAWTASELEKKATNVIDEECKEASVTSVDYKKPAETPSRPCESKLPGSPTAPTWESKIGTRRKLPVVRPKSVKGSCTARVAETRKEKSAVVSDFDDDNHVPDVHPKCRLFDDSSSLTGEQLNQDVEQFDAQQVDPITPSIALVQVTEYDFDREFDLNFVWCPEVKEILLKVEQKKYTKPLEMELLKTLEKPPATPPITAVHPRLKGVKLGEDKEDMELLATYEGRPYLRLLRKDLCTLKARGWVNSNIIQWMCYAFNDAQSERFKRDFYCVCSGILETVMQPHNLESFHNGLVAVYKGLGPNFGEDSRFFNKVDAAKIKWWFIPMCSRGHWWLYAIEVARKRIVVIDSLHDEAHDNERKKLDSYGGRLIEDMAKVAIPTYGRSPNGPMCVYAKVPMQPNGWDCGIYAIKFMETWNEGIEHVVDRMRSNVAGERIWSKTTRRNSPVYYTGSVGDDEAAMVEALGCRGCTVLLHGDLRWAARRAGCGVCGSIWLAMKSVKPSPWLKRLGMNQRSEEESMQSGEHMKKPKIWISSSTRTRTVRTRVDRENARNAHAHWVNLVGLILDNSHIVKLYCNETSFVNSKPSKIRSSDRCPAAPHRTTTASAPLPSASTSASIFAFVVASPLFFFFSSYGFSYCYSVPACASVGVSACVSAGASA